MRLLVTGATGFIGSHLLKRLSKEHEIFALVRPSSETSKIDKYLFKKIIFSNVEELKQDIINSNIKGIIHLASLYIKQHTADDIHKLLESNVTYPTQILEACSDTPIEWFINTSTFWEHYENKEYSPLNLYAATKKAFEDIAQYYMETSKLKFITLKLCDTFGPNDCRPKIMNLWLQYGNNGKSLKMSPGEQLINISYIDNVIDAYELLLTHLVENKIKSKKTFCVSSDQLLNLKDLYSLFEKATGITVDIDWGYYPYKDRENMKPWENGVLVDGWSPKVDIFNGIKKCFAEGSKKDN